MSEVFTGKQIEEMFNIPQQYRSRYDKTFCNFISPSDEKPRSYIQSDVIAYEAIVKSSKMSRVIVLKQLAEMASKNIIPFYPTQSIKTLDDIINYSPLAKMVNQDTTEKTIRVKPAKSPRADRIDLAVELGKVQGKLEIIDENVNDLDVTLDILKKTIESQKQIIDVLLMRVSVLEGGKNAKAKKAKPNTKPENEIKPHRSSTPIASYE